jgi:calpain-7
MFAACCSTSFTDVVAQVVLIFIHSSHLISTCVELIMQDTISDCSFVCSLCIASAFERRFRKQLITRIIYPQDARGMPVYNPSGKYLIKLWINGVPRKILVDDLLPVGQGGKLLCSSSIENELWVSLIEKAYMKVNGGYDFPGSNSGIDLFALTGWLPEQVYFEEHRKSRGNSISTNTTSNGESGSVLDSYQPAERVWQRLLSAHTFGDSLITVSTESEDTLPKDEADRMGLVPGHAYAVLDVREVNGIRLLQVSMYVINSL